MITHDLNGVKIYFHIFSLAEYRLERIIFADIDDYTEYFKIRSAEILLIGNAPYDMQCAKAAGEKGAPALCGTTAPHVIPVSYCSKISSIFC